jgi:carboxypeptidase C (cathepsin A)
VTFVFNGGPGASSAYLHMAAMGPRVLVMGANGTVPEPPVRLVDNPDSWLAFTDLVFIDPVGTGLAPAREDDGGKPFWNVDGDAASLAGLIRLWCARNGRWLSPKLLAGESYGGYRAAMIARTLLDTQGLALNGIVMISPVLDFSLISQTSSGVLPWALLLPSLWASAREHGLGDASISAAEVERFALTDYLTGIAAIGPAGPGPEPALNDRIAALLGLDRDLVRTRHARLSAGIFADRLLQASGRRLSLYDGGVAAPNPTPGQRGGPDPILQGTIAPLSTAYNAYVRDVLKLRSDLPFRLLAARPGHNWDWQGARGGPGPHGSAVDELAEALALTPGLGVLVVHGRTDLVTPYMSSRWALDRLDLPEAVRAAVRVEVLEGGHMMYFRAAQRAALSRLAAGFVRTVTER